MRAEDTLTYIQEVVKKRWILVDDELLDLQIKHMY